MRILVLGGTGFAGRALVDGAVSRGHDVTTFTRGHHGEPRLGVEALHGDRTIESDLAVLAGRDWDAVIDTSVLAPVHVAASARLLAGHAGRYAYLSTLAVYPDLAATPVTEESPVWECPPDATGDKESLGYGPLKAGSERAVMAAFGSRHLIARAGHLAGPHDDVGGLPWWLARMARGGRVLAGPADQPVRLTDVRDLGVWLVDSVRRGIGGAVNVPGPQGSTMGALLAACATAVAAHGGPTPVPAWADDGTLLAAGVEPSTELPLWVPDRPELAGTWTASGERALLAGMRYRPLADTVKDTWSWLSRAAAARGVSLHQAAQRPGVGLDQSREQEILSRL